jgi:hypothetical protein
MIDLALLLLRSVTGSVLIGHGRWSRACSPARKQRAQRNANPVRPGAVVRKRSARRLQANGDVTRSFPPESAGPRRDGSIR